jgi:hypothetical protein
LPKRSRWHKTTNRALRPQERLRIDDWDREIRPAEVSHHRKIYSDDLALTVEQWPAGAAGSRLGVVDDLVRKDVADVALGHNGADQMPACQLLNHLFRITFRTSLDGLESFCPSASSAPGRTLRRQTARNLQALEWHRVRNVRLEHMPSGRWERSGSLAPSQAWAESSAGSITQHSPAFRDEGRELALKPLSCTAAPAVSDRR